MRFHLGPIPDDWTPDPTWRPIREPGPILFQVFAFPVGIGTMLGVGFCWRLNVLASQPPLRGPVGLALLFVGMILSIPSIIITHELLHAIAYPRFGCTRSTIIGAWPRKGLFYAHYRGPLSRDRFLACFAMPFLIITILPLALAAVGRVPASFRGPLAWCSIWNALFSCGDLFGFALILTQVPRSSIVQNQGWRTFWKPAASTAASVEAGDEGSL